MLLISIPAAALLFCARQPVKTEPPCVMMPAEPLLLCAEQSTKRQVRPPNKPKAVQLAAVTLMKLPPRASSEAPVVTQLIPLANPPAPPSFTTQRSAFF